VRKNGGGYIMGKPDEQTHTRTIQQIFLCLNVQQPGFDMGL